MSYVYSLNTITGIFMNVCYWKTKMSRYEKKFTKELFFILDPSMFSVYCHTRLELGFWIQAVLWWESEWVIKSDLTNPTTHHPPGSWIGLNFWPDNLNGNVIFQNYAH